MNPIRKLVQHLVEAAVASQQAASQGLALLRRSSGSDVTYVLYDPSKLMEELPKWEDANGDVTSVVYGFLVVRDHDKDCWSAGEIKYSAAQKGYGPLMYELAMSDFENGLFPDRGSTSDPARNVWKKYMQRSDITKFPFDDRFKPKTPPKHDDCNVIPDYDGDVAYLNQAYLGQGDSGGKARMIQLHKDAAAAVADQLAMSVQNVEAAIDGMGDEYFSIRYRENY